MSERQGVEIDYCPECRGVWLDRGELDKILDRAQAEVEAMTGGASQAPAAAQTPTQPHAQSSASAPGQQSGYNDPRYSQPSYDDRRHDSYDRHSYDRDYGRNYDRDRGHGDSRYGSKKKRRPLDFLGELFD